MTLILSSRNHDFVINLLNTNTKIGEFTNISDFMKEIYRNSYIFIVN